MKASSTWCLLGAVFLITIVVPKAGALSPQETCQIVKNGTFIGDPANCQGWYYCLNGQAIAGQCKTGYLYNSYTGSCDYPSNVICSQTSKNMCQGLDAQFVRDPSSCSGYCYCSGGVANCTTCPKGQYFDLAGVQCTWEKGSCVSGSPCLLAQNDFIKNPDSCAGWYRCGNGQVVDEGDCTNELLYNAFKGMCDYAANVGCSVPTTTTTTTTTSLPPTSCSASGYVADPNSCNGYYYCDPSTDAAGVPSYTTHYAVCPAGSQFDVTSPGSCTNSYNVKCPNDRCAGVKSTYMTVLDTDCKSYVICTNGVSSKIQYSCPSPDYSFFNEQLQACQKTKPTELPICA